MPGRRPAFTPLPRARCVPCHLRMPPPSTPSSSRALRPYRLTMRIARRSSPSKVRRPLLPPPPLPPFPLHPPPSTFSYYVTGGMDSACEPHSLCLHPVGPLPLLLTAQTTIARIAPQKTTERAVRAARHFYSRASRAHLTRLGAAVDACAELLSQRVTADAAARQAAMQAQTVQWQKVGPSSPPPLPPPSLPFSAYVPRRATAMSSALPFGSALALDAGAAVAAAGGNAADRWLREGPAEPQQRLDLAQPAKHQTHEAVGKSPPPSLPPSYPHPYPLSAPLKS